MKDKKTVLKIFYDYLYVIWNIKNKIHACIDESTKKMTTKRQQNGLSFLVFNCNNDEEKKSDDGNERGKMKKKKNEQSQGNKIERNTH